MTLQILHPRTVEEAAALLEQGGARAVPLAGGAWLAPRLRRDIQLPDALFDQVDTVVDLADLPLRYIQPGGAAGERWLAIGATTPLADLVDDPQCRALAGGILAEAARRAAPVNVRNRATVGGCVVVGESASELLLALAALNAAAVSAAGASWPALEPRPGQLIAEIRVPLPAAARGALARVARTPSDQPIVAAAAVMGTDGIRVALGGVAARVVVGTAAEEGGLEETLAARLAGESPFSDFRGSAEYRQAMAPIVARRAVEAAAAGIGPAEDLPVAT